MAATQPVAAPTLIYLVTEDWYFCSHRLPIARAARDAGWRVVVATRVGSHGAGIEAEGFELRALGMRRRRAQPLAELRSLLEIASLYRRERPALVHQVALKPMLYGTLAALLAGVPSVINAVAGLGFVFSSESPRARLLRPLVRVAYRALLARRRVRVIVQNVDDAAEISRLGVPESRIALIPGSGVDVRRFAPAPEPAGPVVATLVARMLRDKGVVELVEAARLLRALQAPIVVRLVGPPDPENPASIEPERIRAWEREGLVQWCPGTRDVPGVWRDSHVGVLPSYREGLPKSLLEAAACGRALVATDVPGCREVVVHGETGLLVPPRDPRALADALQRLAEDAALRRRLGAAARERAVRCFSEQQVVRATLDLYGPRPLL